MESRFKSKILDFLTHPSLFFANEISKEKDLRDGRKKVLVQLHKPLHFSSTKLNSSLHRRRRESCRLSSEADKCFAGALYSVAQVGLNFVLVQHENRGKWQWEIDTKDIRSRTPNFVSFYDESVRITCHYFLYVVHHFLWRGLVLDKYFLPIS